MQKRRKKKYLQTLIANIVIREEKYTCIRRRTQAHVVVRMEQQQFSEVEVDKVVASSNSMEVEELVLSSNNMEVEVMANHEHVLCILDALDAGVLEP